MRRAESVFALLVALLCAVYLFFSWKIKFGSMTEPEAGFMPVVLGVAGLIVSLALLAGSLQETVSKQAAEISREGKMRFIGCVAVCIIFIPVFEILGTIIAIFALALALTKILGSKGWLRPVLLATASSVIAYALFCIALDVPLPQGIF